jgi:hypothetical protein
VVRDITGNQNEVNDLFVVTKKAPIPRRTTPIHDEGLKDATAPIDGRVWERVDELEGLFERGDIVSVRSKARTSGKAAAGTSPTSASSMPTLRWRHCPFLSFR